MDATVSEIHRYPLRPEGFSEPLFLGYSAKKEIAEHLAASEWLSRASEAPRGAVEERCHVFRRADGGVCLLRREGRGRRQCETPWRKRRIRHVLERWREVSGWWEPNEAGRMDRLCYRVLASGGEGEAGAILDLAYERASGRWLLAAVVD